MNFIIRFIQDGLNRAGVSFLLTIGLLLSIIWAGCGGGEEKPADNASGPSMPLFENLEKGMAFVGDDACFGCHEDQYRGFKKHGMANAVYALSETTEVEVFDESVVYDSTLGYYYRVFKDDGRYFQEEYRLGEDGAKTHSALREMQVGMGSGISARSYFVQNNGWFYELPISWYTQGSKWDFSPGYRAGNKRFDRKIGTRCVSCHSAYPDEVPYTDGKFDHIPLGITCERCHGPGELHVNERLATPEADSVDLTIVNPAHLSLERKLDVCQQCHLNPTISLLRKGRTATDYRPSQDLAAFVALFEQDAPVSNTTIGLTSHVDRMKKSACFIRSVDTSRPLGCATCHDPHSSFRESGPEYFNNTCLSCHAAATLSTGIANSGPAADHTPDSNCISCHMPKADLSRVPHSSFTDHWVRVVGRDDQLAPIAAHDPELLKPVFAIDRGSAPNVYEGMAYVVLGRQTRSIELMQKGIGILESTLQDDPEAYDEAESILAIGYVQIGNPAQAEKWMERAITKNPDIPERLNALAQIYEALGKDPTRIDRLYRRALEIQPARADIRINYGRFLETRGNIESAKQQYLLAIEEEEWLETGYFNLGTALLRSGDVTGAEARLNQAINLNPLNPESWSNLGILFAGQDREEAALAAFEKGVEVGPTNPVALSNLGTHFLANDENDEAVRFLERAVAADANYLDASVNLALAYFRAEQYDKAAEQARKVLLLEPGNPLAQQILDAI